MRIILGFMLRIFILLSLPFTLLIRGAIYLHETQHYTPWMAIGGGAFLASFILVIYMVFFYGKITGEVGSISRKLWLALLIVVAYGTHGLFFLSSNNVKHPSIQSEFISLHPILRLSISTIIHFDEDLIITDANRQPEDYRKMGMRSKKHSLHYRQKSSGYVHAVDIRTNNRGSIRNLLLSLYFRAMGFNTLRHGGTGDHLHISINSAERPGAI